MTSRVVVMMIVALLGAGSLGAAENAAKPAKPAANTAPKPAKPAATVAFRGQQALRAGRNVFWLSCRLKSTADLSHRVAAACHSIDTTAGKLIPRDLSPGTRHRIGIALRKHKDDGVHTYRIPALATTPVESALS